MTEPGSILSWLENDNESGILSWLENDNESRYPPFNSPQQPIPATAPPLLSVRNPDGNDSDERESPQAPELHVSESELDPEGPEHVLSSAGVDPVDDGQEQAYIRGWSVDVDANRRLDRDRDNWDSATIITEQPSPSPLMDAGSIGSPAPTVTTFPNVRGPNLRRLTKGELFYDWSPSPLLDTDFDYGCVQSIIACVRQRTRVLKC